MTIKKGSIYTNRWRANKRRVKLTASYRKMAAFHLAMLGDPPGLAQAFEAATDHAVMNIGTDAAYGLLDFSDRLLTIVHDLRDGPTEPES